jgi:hypothetical protein
MGVNLELGAKKAKLPRKMRMLLRDCFHRCSFSHFLSYIYDAEIWIKKSIEVIGATFTHHNRFMKHKILRFTNLLIICFCVTLLLSLYLNIYDDVIQNDIFTESSTNACAPWIQKQDRNVILVNRNGVPKIEETLIIRALGRIDFVVYLVSIDTFNNFFHVKDLHKFHRIFYVIDDFMWSKQFDQEQILCKVRIFPVWPSSNHDKLLFDGRLHEKNVMISPESLYTPTRQGLMNDAICSIMEDDSLCNCKKSEVKDCRGAFFLHKSKVYN